MKLLLDTYIWIWSVAEPERLSSRVRNALDSSENEIWLSPISIWEFLLLVEKGRLTPGMPALRSLRRSTYSVAFCGADS